MGFLDLILGRRIAKGDDPEEEMDQQKAYGDLYAGGQGRPNRNESDAREVNPLTQRKANRLTDELEEVERRAKLSHLDEKHHLEKSFGKIERAIGGVSDAPNSLVLRQREAKLRRKLRGGLEKIENEHAGRLEELKRKGATDRHIKEEELKMRRIKEDMSKMYRRSGGSGMLK